MKREIQLMAILNVTPDSLFGSRVGDFGMCIRKMLDEGADIVDVGGESTGPGSSDVSPEEEWARIEPALKILQNLKKERDFQISVDTYKADVFERALQYGVDILNDVTALCGDPKMVKLVAENDAKVCLMYAVQRLSAKGNEIRTNTEEIQYDDVIKTIGDALEERMNFCTQNGIDRSKIILDPGMGAFVSGDHKYSWEILDRLQELKERFPDLPLLIGASRKGFTGPGLPPEERLPGSLKAAELAVRNGADILRVHDIAPTKALL
ncbi:dihydropteroate synthase [Candidatus Peregrinibacteria bacterium]|jgi:dihydropteroate synthase|nr:dihydropteroate synthase [Candidatus Peregrinibacteria bacterium]